MATKKTSSAKKTTAKKKSAARKGGTARKTTARKSAAKPTAKSSGQHGAGTLHNVARSLGSTLGSLAKKTTKAVEAAKNVLPFGEQKDS